MSNYAQWYVEATAHVAREAHRRMMAGERELWLYYKPQGLAFRVCGYEERTEGWSLVTGERLPSDRTVEQLTGYFHDLCRSVPVLPGD